MNTLSCSVVYGQFAHKTSIKTFLSSVGNHSVDITNEKKKSPVKINVWVMGLPQTWLEHTDYCGDWHMSGIFWAYRGL
jgi:hypothetical protein